MIQDVKNSYFEELNTSFDKKFKDDEKLLLDAQKNLKLK